MGLLKIIVIVFVLVIIFVVLMSAIYLKWLRVVETTITENNIECDHKLVLLSDLHNFQYGKQNIKLIKAVSEQNPEFILIAGDLLVDTKSDNSIARSLLSELLKMKCQIFYVPGNHEIKYMNNFPEQWIEFENFLKISGIIFLNDSGYETRDIYFSGYTNKLTHYAKFKKLYSLTAKEMSEELPEYHGDKCNFLLAHNPEFFDVYSKWGADIVVSGHLHGGIICLPVIGGILSPQTFFGPRYSFGTYNKGKSSMIVTAGLGVHTIPIRLFNRPDITVINLLKEITMEE